MAHLWRTSQDIAGCVWKLETFGSKMAHLWRCPSILHTKPPTPPPSCHTLSLTNRHSARQRPIGRGGSEIRGAKKPEVKMKTQWVKTGNQECANFLGENVRKDARPFEKCTQTRDAKAFQGRMPSSVGN